MKYALDLDQQQSSRVLDHAVQSQAQVLLQIPGDTTGDHCGQFVSADDSVVLIELTRPLPTRPDALTGRFVEVHVFIDQRYLFTTNIMKTGAKLDPCQLALRRPAMIQVLQRRRFGRARLAPSSTARITLTGSAVAKTLETDLLNISAEGLACRLPARLSGALRIGDACEVSFELPDDATPFTFAAVVRNMTPASDNATIAGLQFDFAAEKTEYSKARKLRDCLYHREPAMLAAGVRV